MQTNLSNGRLSSWTFYIVLPYYRFWAVWLCSSSPLTRTPHYIHWNHKCSIILCRFAGVLLTDQLGLIKLFVTTKLYILYGFWHYWLSRRIYRISAGHLHVKLSWAFQSLFTLSYYFTNFECDDVCFWFAAVVS